MLDVFTSVVLPLEEAVLTLESTRKSYVHCVHPGRSGTHYIPSGPSCYSPSTASVAEQLQDVAVKTVYRRVARHWGRGGVISWMELDRTDSELEVTAVSSGQLDDDRHYITWTIATNYNTRRIATS